MKTSRHRWPATPASGKVPVVLLYHRVNRNSFNALLGALESEPAVADRVAVTLARTNREFLEAVRAAENAPVVLTGFSLATLQLLQEMRFLQGFLGHRPANVVAVAGGPHPAGLPEPTLALGFDLVVVGEGEKTFLELCERLLAGEAITGLPGTVWREGDGVAYGPVRPPHDLSRYHSGSPRFGAVSTIELSRGCPCHCAYCQTPELMPRPVRHRSLTSVVSQIQRFYLPTFQDFRFVAPNALGYRGRGADGQPVSYAEFLRACRDAAAPGRIFVGTFPSEVRPESVTEDKLALLRRYAANDNLTIGLQSGSDAVLRRMRRGHDVAAAVRAIRLAREAGFRVNVDVIFALPGESEAEARESLAVLDELTAQGARIHAHAYVPLPGSRLWPQPPAPFYPVVEEYLRKRLPTGQVFGYWQHHREHARDVLAAFARSV